MKVSNQSERSKVPLFSSKAKAGFPSPADNTIERKLDLNELIVQHPASTFFVRVAGDSMIGAGIHEDDILCVDRSLSAKNNDIVLAILNGEFTVKRFKRSTSSISLVPENPKYPAINIQEGDDFEVWGVVTYLVRKT